MQYIGIVLCRKREEMWVQLPIKTTEIRSQADASLYFCILWLLLRWNAPKEQAAVWSSDGEIQGSHSSWYMWKRNIPPERAVPGLLLLCVPPHPCFHFITWDLHSAPSEGKAAFKHSWPLSKLLPPALATAPSPNIQSGIMYTIHCTGRSQDTTYRTFKNMSHP